jgi:hypothetical protein
MLTHLPHRNGIACEAAVAMVSFGPEGGRLDIERKRAMFPAHKISPGIHFCDARVEARLSRYRSSQRPTEFQEPRHSGLKKKFEWRSDP